MTCDLCHGPIVHGDGGAPSRHLLIETCIRYLGSKVAPLVDRYSIGADGELRKEPRPPRRRKKR